MTPMSALMAAALLVTPPDTPEQPVTPEQWPAMQEQLQTTAIAWEILDPREVRYVLARPEDFESDLNLLRRRYQDLADAPRVADSQRLPDRNTVNELLAFNRAYRRNLEARQPVELDRAEDLRAAQRETDRLYQVWDTVRDARCEFYYVTVRRQALKRLRELLGDGSFQDGNLPPFVPIWRFQEIR
jgi:hypothetical protein